MNKLEQITKDTNLNPNADLIKEWKEKDVDYVLFKFSCGGDSMNDTELEIINKSGVQITNFIHSGNIDDIVYENVTFYEASDGQYLGEHGTVTVTLNEEGTDFECSLNAISEYCEAIEHEEIVKYEDIPTDIANFLKNYVISIVGGTESGQFSFNYNKDFILTEELTKLQEKIEKFFIDILWKIDFVQVCIDSCHIHEDTDPYMEEGFGIRFLINIKEEEILVTAEASIIYETPRVD